MKYDFDFRVVKKGNFYPTNEWTPPFIYVDNGKDDERSQFASRILERFEECGAKFEGIDKLIGAYNDEFDDDPIMACEDAKLTEAEKNGAKALAMTFCHNENDVEGRESASEFIQKVYSLEPIGTSDQTSEYR